MSHALSPPAAVTQASQAAPFILNLFFHLIHSSPSLSRLKYLVALLSHRQPQAAPFILNLHSAPIPQAAATLLEPVLAAAQAATAQLPPAPSPNPAIPSTSPAQPAAGGAHSLHATHPYLAPLVDRLACLFAYVDQREAVARMLGVYVGL
eukprot:1161348-Pelagomonas_calceolata.AAC.3